MKYSHNYQRGVSITTILANLMPIFPFIIDALRTVIYHSLNLVLRCGSYNGLVEGLVVMMLPTHIHVCSAIVIFVFELVFYSIIPRSVHVVIAALQFIIVQSKWFPFTFVRFVVLRTLLLMELSREVLFKSTGQELLLSIATA